MVRNKHVGLPNPALQGSSQKNTHPSIQLASPAKSRLSLISRHLDEPHIALNTPFSRERVSAVGLTSVLVEPSNPTDMMSTQANHPTLLIPGPVEFDDEVLQSMAHYR
jgi:alanine-glyoxylate transaminase/serine-glyoxylate transaminase/serine-pyruvate transaminase